MFEKNDGEKGINKEKKISWLNFITFHWVTKFLNTLQSGDTYALPEFRKNNGFVQYAQLLEKHLKDVKVRKMGRFSWFSWFRWFRKSKKSYVYVKKKGRSDFNNKGSYELIRKKGNAIKKEDYYYLDSPSILWSTVKTFRVLIIKVLLYRVLYAFFLIGVAMILENYIVTMKEEKDFSVFLSISRMFSGVFLVLLLILDIVIHCIIHFYSVEVTILIEVAVMYLLFNINLANPNNNLIFSNTHRTIYRSGKTKGTFGDIEDDTGTCKRKNKISNCANGENYKKVKKIVKKNGIQNDKNNKDNNVEDTFNNIAANDINVNNERSCKSIYDSSSSSSGSFFLSEKSCSTDIKCNESVFDNAVTTATSQREQKQKLRCHSFYYKNARYVAENIIEKGIRDFEELKKKTGAEAEAEAGAEADTNANEEASVSPSRAQQFLEFIKCYKREKELNREEKRRRGYKTGRTGTCEDDIMDLSIYNIMFIDAPCLSYFFNALINLIITVIRFCVSFITFYYKMGKASALYGIILTIIIYGTMCFLEILASCFRDAYLKYRDKRLDNAQHVLKEFKLIKILNWEKMAFDYVNHYRNKELKFCKIRIYLRSLSSFLNDISTNIIEVIVLFSFLKDEINKKKEFDIVQILTPLFVYKSLITGLTNFPNIMNDIIEGSIAMERIDKYICYYLYHNNINIYFKYRDSIERRAQHSSFAIDDSFSSAFEEAGGRKKNEKENEKNDNSSNSSNSNNGRNNGNVNDEEKKIEKQEKEKERDVVYATKRGNYHKKMRFSWLFFRKKNYVVLEKELSELYFETNLNSNSKPMKVRKIRKGEHVAKNYNDIYRHNDDDVSGNYKEESRKEVIVKLQNCYFSLNQKNENKTECILKNINFELKNNTLAIIVGNISSGKTAFFQSILGNFKLSYGQMYVKNFVQNMPILYVPQFRWVNFGTIRSMILFGNKFDAAIYNYVVNQSELGNDFLTFKKKDMRFINDGHNLSGGQKTRICLARALYHHYVHMVEVNRKNQRKKNHYLNFLLQKEISERSTKNNNSNITDDEKNKISSKNENIETDYLIKYFDGSYTQMGNTVKNSCTDLSCKYERTTSNILASSGERYNSEGKDSEMCPFFSKILNDSNYFKNLDAALKEEKIFYLYLIDDLFTSLDPCICNNIFISLFCENEYNNLYKNNCSFIITVNENILQPFLKREILENLQYKVDIYKLEENTLIFKGDIYDYVQGIENARHADEMKRENDQKNFYIGEEKKESEEGTEEENVTAKKGNCILNSDNNVKFIDEENNVTLSDKRIIGFSERQEGPVTGRTLRKMPTYNEEIKIERQEGADCSEKDKCSGELMSNSGINQTLPALSKTSSNRRSNYIYSFISEIETDEQNIDNETYFRGNVKAETFFWYFKNVGYFLLTIISFFMIIAVFTEELKNLLMFIITKYNVNNVDTAGANDNNVVQGGNESSTSNSVDDLNAMDSTYVSQTRYLSLFLISPIISVFFSLLCYLLIAHGSLVSAQRIHTEVLRNILHAPMHVFYSSNVGNLMNRLSTDVNVLDIGILKRIYKSIYGLFRFSFTLILLVIMIKQTILISPLVLIAIYFFVFRRYSEGCKETQRGYLRSHSPLCNMYSNTILGKVVINLYKKNEYFLKKYQEITCTFQNYVIIKWAVSCWASFYTQMICLFLTSFYIIFPYIYLSLSRNNLSSAFYQKTLNTVGYCITFSCSLSIMVKVFLYDYTHNEKEMCSIQRLEECAKMIEDEQELKKEKNGTVNNSVTVCDNTEVDVKKREEKVGISGINHEMEQYHIANSCDDLGLLEMECNIATTEEAKQIIPAAPTFFEDKIKYGIFFEEVYVSYRERTNINAKKNIYTYSYDRCCLRNINLYALKNQKIGIVGRSGSGKSTMILAILGLIPTIRGRILIEGMDIKNLKRCEKNNIIGVLPQSSFVFLNWNIRTFIDPYQNFKDEEIVEAFKMIGINLNHEDLCKYIYKQKNKKKQNNMSYRLFGIGRTKKDKRVKKGNAFISLTDDCIRYLSLVRLFLNRHKYKLILLDEMPVFNFEKLQEDNKMSNFFTNDVKSFDYILRNYFKDITVIIVAHDTSTLSSCDFVYVLGKGEVVYRCRYKDVETQNKLAELLERNEEERVM